MKFKNILLAFALAFSASATNAANQPASLNGFDFNYSVDLNRSIGLTQVFDDGDRTYFQFTQAESLPSVYVIKDGKKQNVALEARPPYLIAPGVANKYMLSAPNGKTSIYVSYNGSRPVDVVAKEIEQKRLESVEKIASTEKQQSVKKVAKPTKSIDTVTIQAQPESDDDNKSMTGLVTGTLLNIPFFENSVSLSKKARSDLSQRIEEIVASTKIVVRGRPSVKGDNSLAATRALAIKNYLVDIGVDEGLIETTQEPNIKRGKNEGFYVSELILLSGEKTTKSNASAKPKKQYWDLALADNNLETALNKWAAKAGYQPIVWDLQEEIPINSSVRFEGSFEEALDAMIQSLRNTDFPLKAKYYSNKVVRITSLTGAK